MKQTPAWLGLGLGLGIGLGLRLGLGLGLGLGILWRTFAMADLRYGGPESANSW